MVSQIASWGGIQQQGLDINKKSLLSNPCHCRRPIFPLLGKLALLIGTNGCSCWHKSGSEIINYRLLFTVHIIQTISKLLVLVKSRQIKVHSRCFDRYGRILKCSKTESHTALKSSKRSIFSKLILQKLDGKR